ncbi:MAG TPA: hypothetical protein VJ761_19140 [Ktedonobacteraceae bacterium]|nr:hypothetical protein [Ktedonobacteraceae bacterium]
MMTTPLRITSRLSVTPLLTIQHPPFEKLYRDGVYWSLFKDRCRIPLSDRYMLENIRATLRETDIDGQHAYWLPTIGFHFGRMHGAILSAHTGQPRQGITALVSFVNKDAAHGYAIGRQWYFVDAAPDEERTCTDAQLIERLQELESHSVNFSDEEGTYSYTLGCILGELSGQLFPMTAQDTALWEELERQFWTQHATPATRRAPDTDSLDPVPVVEYTV